MGLINSVESIKRELNYNSRQAQARYTQAQIKTKYKNDIENVIWNYLEIYNAKYEDTDELYYRRYEYIGLISDKIIENDVDRLYSGFNISFDVNKTFSKVFDQFIKQKKHDDEIDNRFKEKQAEENYQGIKGDESFLKKEHIMINILVILCVIILIKTLVFSINITGLIILIILLAFAKFIFTEFKRR